MTAALQCRSLNLLEDLRPESIDLALAAQKAGGQIEIPAGQHDSAEELRAAGLGVVVDDRFYLNMAGVAVVLSLPGGW